MDTSDRIEYTGVQSGTVFMDHYFSGRIKQIGEKWYVSLWNVSYSQSNHSHGETFTCKAEAEAYWESKLSELRKSWGHNGSKFGESAMLYESGKAILFRSIRKNGKPGTLTGRFTMSSMANMVAYTNKV